MKEPKRIPLTDSPRNKEPKKIPLTYDQDWEVHDTNLGPPVLARNNENNRQDNTTSIQQLESDETD
jgi:hypothetical protein